MPAKNADETPTEVDVWEDDTVISDRDMITISLKGGSGTQAWVVGHFNDVSEALSVLSDDRWDELMALVAQRGNDLVEAHGGSAKPAPRAAASSSRGGSTWGNKSSGGSQRSSRKGKVTEDEDGMITCKHGDAVERSGVKNGKSWSGMFCPSTDRNDQCDPIWD